MPDWQRLTAAATCQLTPLVQQNFRDCLAQDRGWSFVQNRIPLAFSNQMTSWYGTLLQYTKQGCAKDSLAWAEAHYSHLRIERRDRICENMCTGGMCDGNFFLTIAGGEVLEALDGLAHLEDGQDGREVGRVCAAPKLLGIVVLKLCPVMLWTEHKTTPSHSPPAHSADRPGNTCCSRRVENDSLCSFRPCSGGSMCALGVEELQYIICMHFIRSFLFSTFLS